jgi:hypothetical protein
LVLSAATQPKLATGTAELEYASSLHKQQAERTAAPEQSATEGLNMQQHDS